MNDYYISRQAVISTLLHESIVMSNGNCIIPQVFGINRILEIPLCVDGEPFFGDESIADTDVRRAVEDE